MSYEITFYFLRHGETKFNEQGLIQGHLDVPLNTTGHDQAARAAKTLKNKPIAQIVSSPLSRAKQTPEIVASHHDVNIIFDDGLMECHLGDQQGEPDGDWLDDYWAGFFDPANGETFHQFSERAWNAMQRAISYGPNTLIVAHKGLMYAAQEYVTFEPIISPIPNATPVLIHPNNGVWNLTLLK